LSTGVTGTLAVANGGTGITAFGSGVATALGVNVGSAGAFVVNGGALGTPSSGTVTNLTGTASININGTVGATTPNTGSFTTLTTSSTVTINGGTANGVAYLNGSKVLTTGSALTFDGSQLGVGTAGSTSNGLKLNSGNAGANYVLYRDGTTGLLQVYGNQTGFNGLLVSGVDGQQYLSDPAKHIWSVSNSEQMRLTSTGLGIGTSSPNTRLTIGGYSSANQTPDIQITRSSSGTAIQTGPNITFGDGTTNNTTTLQVTQGRFGVWNYGSGAWNERLSIDAAGNLGLGVTPSAWSGVVPRALQFQYGCSIAAQSNAYNLHFLRNAYFDGGWKYLNSAPAVRFALNDDAGTGGFAWFYAGSGNAGDTISFTQAMTLDASGRLGLGATSPGTNLHIGTGSSPENLGVTLSRGATTNFYLAHDGTKTFIAGIDPANDGPKIGSLNSYPFLFVTGNSERARITSGGDLLVGTTSTQTGVAGDAVGITLYGPSATGTGIFVRNGVPLYANNKNANGALIQFYCNGNNVGTISSDGTSTAYNTSSDYRLKDNPQPLTGSGAFIDALKPKTWNWKSDGSKGVGFIAHEVQEVSPGSVTGEKDGEQMQAMEYGSAEFIANIIAELQSLRARVAQLENLKGN
jgi:hypothetical protein